MEEEAAEAAAASHSHHPHRPFTPTLMAQALPSSHSAADPTPLLVRLPPELLRAVARGFLPPRDRARLSLACRHCHEGEQQGCSGRVNTHT
jgi:hypothetical protein